MPDKYLESTALQQAVEYFNGNEPKQYDPFKVQIGGNHYKDFVIQPGDFISKNKLYWYEGNVVKYICRNRFKGQQLEDLKKAKHYCELAIAEAEEQNAK